LYVNHDQGWAWRWKAIHENTMNKRCRMLQQGARLSEERIPAFKLSHYLS
jgi:hypothetical protein